MIAECLLGSVHPRLVGAGLVLRHCLNDRDRAQVVVVQLDADGRRQSRSLLERAKGIVEVRIAHAAIVSPRRHRRVTLSVQTNIATLIAIHAAAHSHSGSRNSRAIVAASERPRSTRNRTRMSYTASSATWIASRLSTSFAQSLFFSPSATSAMPHASTTTKPNRFLIQTTSVKSMHAPTLLRIACARRSTRVAAISRHPTALAPR